ncbi:hypothetical protein N7509_006214 [Penicillium cosmopolitanum]|uniref:DNA polymerase delta subunit 3 n=1 Tax=Penicillium cosmopolitanum TaxID=1131564 RepID=A0A9X0BAR8_9EURO|nr:uncharacterized protein N7509_006214 [Penicillium cosmopolitanum]KAJ5398101.1 hypothetical protein N7509_006214 [Penicillium cosmopolitanum]
MDYKMYLAENVLNERRTVTYRALSRALKVHATKAKQMLYDFHRNENAKKPQSVHATYVISGFQKPPAAETPVTNGHAKDEDEVMQSSPYLPSSMPNQDASFESPRVMSIIIAREEDLEDAKSTFHSISTIHVYSLQPTVLQDLNTLTDVCREIATAHAQDDPLECGGQWGMIQNRNVKRRTGARPPPPAAKSKSEPMAPKAKAEPAVPTKRPLQKEESTPQPTSESESQSSSKPAAKTAPKREKSNLFSSFAKAKPKQKTSTPAQSTDPSQDGQFYRDYESYASSHITVVLDDASEEEQEELFPESGDKSAPANRESKKDREDKLKQMMEDEDTDDEEMPDADEEPEREPTPVEQPPPPKPAELKEEVTVQGGRRRGKRQVMKKRTVKDEEGYLVTREEPSWESFSEDEPAPPKKKPAVNVPKGKGPKAGQGNIMSFFGKK